ncbi:hypothetical protein MCOR27_003611 [Pyricularia oryzae]|uniref:Peptide hydrolase n=1 Tax=Pyricularia grisea TaxID=148305 RepID=A0ABQ8NTY2_PYRGI|nr:hypothetical protein MCOR19_004117 [Pyricularia oryzae]KAI6302059.1 hypothetical protein MCOR33_002517 [Pyricularia grisea]KAI6275854.1 hypothetical protein MCOR26_005829 [Pyricularia oryzae]KAI6282670.1 hypothetical protein MCOR27_003611 [Pyricularia oryzae]KAI6324448.1 hypothetical protein MCOR29_004024 [Pyricularia oryzae]
MSNPFAFRSAQVTFWTTVVYLALLVPLVVINEGVPPVQPDGSLFLDRGLNLTEAWLDLGHITERFHHQNSRENDVVRDYLRLRIEQIIAANDAEARTTVFNDLTSNVTYLAWGSAVPTHYQGNNLYVYIRGKDDDQGEWWHNARAGKLIGKGGVLVNAHFDSVSTAYGATDDGMGTVTVLQMIRYFTKPGNQPQRGIVALLNNAEEPGLLGAAAFGKSPLLPFIHTFLNLEGAGAGSRCVLFRSTDREVTSAFSNVQSPFGSVVGSDGFKMGLVRSGTDYSVWHDIYGQRGLDLAFYRPRALYHTNQDDTKHTSRESLWQMMAASTTTLINLSADTGSDYIGDRPDGDRSKAPNGSPSDGVWFDLFGSTFVLFGLRGMFAWSLTVLIVGPLTLFGMMYLVHKQGKGYAFHTKLRATSDSSSEDGDDEDGEVIRLGGWKGFFRFPFALIVAGALVTGAALLLRKMNPFIIYSSEYAVWAMMISLFYFGFWLIMRGSSYTRPSALHRLYVHIWLFILGWVALVFATVLEDRMRIASGYIFVFWESQVFLATLVAVCELFSLPRKIDFARGAAEEAEVRDHLEAVPHSDAVIAPSLEEATRPQRAGQSSNSPQEDDEDDVPDEETPLFRKAGRGNKLDTSFLRRGYRRSVSAIMDSNNEAEDGPKRKQPFEGEQAWSGPMVTSTWILQFLLLGPFMVILGGQVGLLLTSAVNQTGVDGSSLLAPYLMIAALSAILLMPLSPFIHRVTKHVPLFLLAVAFATLIYSLVAFPFSPRAPYKTFFRQTVDLDTGDTQVHLAGVEQYLRKIIADVPSALGQEIACDASSSRRDLVDCTYDAAQVPPIPTYGSGKKSFDLPPGVSPGPAYYGKLLTVTVVNTTAKIATQGSKTARLKIDAVNTRVVELRFSKEGPPIRSFRVVGADSWDDRFGAFPDDGARVLRLWRRDWESSFVVDITWKVDGGNTRGLEGRAVALWSDANDAVNTMPAFREVVRYAPAWATVSKAAPGLVEGSKAFKV